MPAEAIHLSALDDSLARAPAHLRDAIARPALRDAARVGALFVDLPYFSGFWLSVARYVLRRPPQLSAWGETFHQRAPIAVGRALAIRGARLRRAKQTSAEGDYLLALALGYASHAAVDRSLHPLVNRLARARAEASGRSHLQEHQDVEKFQSLLFHDQRLGKDFMGEPEIAAYISVDVTPLWSRGEVSRGVQDALREALGVRPGARAFRAWAKGYAAYVKLLGSKWGKRVAPPEERERERSSLYDAPGFPAAFEAAVATSVKWMENLAAYAADGTFDGSANAALETVIPEGTLDPLG